MKYSNMCDFEFTDNYMALLPCIVTGLSVDECVRKIALQNRRDQKKKSNKKRAGNVCRACIFIRI